jgi:rSAM/selenodomain-associated transferase 2
LISVIVPVFNEGEELSALVKHLQSLPGLDDVVIVDASTDSKSRAVLEHLRETQSPRFQFVRSDIASRSIQMNQGAALAAGDALLFLHADTRLPNEVATLVDSQLSSHCHWGRFDIRLDASGMVYRLLEKMINIRSRLRHIATGDQAIFVSKQAFDSVGGFPPIVLMEDIGLSKKLKNQSSPGLISTPVVTSARRWKNHGVLKTILLMWKLRFLYWIGVSPDYLAKAYGNER